MKKNILMIIIFLISTQLAKAQDRNKVVLEAFKDCITQEDFYTCLENRLTIEEISQIENIIIGDSKSDTSSITDSFASSSDQENYESCEKPLTNGISTISMFGQMVQSTKSNKDVISCPVIYHSSSSADSSLFRSTIVNFPSSQILPGVKLVIPHKKIPIQKENTYEVYMDGNNGPVIFKGEYNSKDWKLQLTQVGEKPGEKNKPIMIDIRTDPDMKSVISTKISNSSDPSNSGDTTCQKCIVNLDGNFKTLKDFNGGVIIPNAFYRSRNLGKRIKEWEKSLERLGQEEPKTYASIHVMGYDKKEGDYNLKEIQYALSKGKKFLHSYGDPEKGEFVYFDGKYPANVPKADKHRGNIYKQETIDYFMPDKSVQEQFNISKMQEKYVNQSNVYNGDLDGFLLSLQNVVSAEWPVSFHCKGGKHKTGMLAGAIRCLQGESWWFDGPKKHANVWSGFDGIKRKGITKGISALERHEVNLSPAEKEYSEFNPIMFRTQNLAFLKDLCEGKLFKTPEQVNQWIGIKKTFDKKLQERGLEKYSCISSGEFESKYRRRFDLNLDENRLPLLVKTLISQIHNWAKDKPAGATNARFLKDSEGRIQFVVRPFTAPVKRPVHYTIQSNLPENFDRFRYSPHNEIFVPRLARILGISSDIVPQTYKVTLPIVKKDQDETFVVIDYKSGKKEFAKMNSGSGNDKEFEASLTRIKNPAYRKEITQAALFSLLIGNVDLHSENILIDKDEKNPPSLSLIDFSLSMPMNNNKSRHKKPLFSELKIELLDRDTALSFIRKLFENNTFKEISNAISQEYKDISVRGDIQKAFDERAQYLLNIQAELETNPEKSITFEDLMKPLHPDSSGLGSNFLPPKLYQIKSGNLNR